MSKQVIDRQDRDLIDTNRRSFRIASIVFLLAVTVRFIYLYEISANPSFKSPIVDSEIYDITARQFAEGKGFGNNFFFQAFFYQFFLSLVYFFSGSSIIIAKVIQVLLGGLTCVLTYYLGAKIFDRRIGVMAGLITAFYGPLFFYEPELLGAGWATFWAVTVVLLFLKTREKDSCWYWFLLGLCGSLSIITHSVFLPFFLAGCIWLKFQVRRGVSPATRFGALFAGILLIVVPVGLVTLRAVNKFTVLPCSGGINLYVGNNPDYCRTVTVRPGEEWDELAALPARYGMDKTVWQQDKFFKQRVIEYVKNQPLDFAKGLGRKTMEFLSSRELPRELSVYMFAKWSRLLRLLAWKVDGFGFPFGLVFPLAVLGVIFNWRRIPVPLVLFMVFYPLSIILVFVSSRYRVPMVPLLAVLAAAGLAAVVQAARLRRWRNLIIMPAVVAGLVLISTLPGPFCQERVNFDHEFFKWMGRAMNKQGLNDKAMTYYSEALRLKPDSYETYLLMGAGLIGQDKLNDAIECYAKVLRLKPDYPQAHAEMGMALIITAMKKHGKMDEAIEQCKESLRLKPDYYKAQFYWGIALDVQGNLDEAIKHYKEAVRLRPDFIEVRQALVSALQRQKKSKSMTTTDLFGGGRQ